MTRAEEALLAAVIAAPEDDLPRLAYADLCEEHGDDDRAEFVRLQVELARLGDPGPPACGGYYCEVTFDGHVIHRDCRRERLWARAEQLVVTHAPAWAPYPLAAFADAVFRRGFVAEVTLTCAAWVAHGPALVRAAPLERVTLAGKEPMRTWWEDGSQVPWWWVCASRHNNNRPETLPRPLFRALARLRREERRTGTGLGFADRDLALLALSQAALCWARAAAVAAPPGAGV